MRRLYSHITIGDFVFKFVTNVSIALSRETFTDTAVIELPNRIKDKQTGNRRYITDYIKVNDPVTIKLGYYPNLYTRFTGYVSGVTPDSPMRIKCEDESFKLKQKTVGPYSASDTTLSALLSDLYDGVTDITDATIGDIRIDQYATLVNVFDDLKRRFGIRSYFVDGVLTVFKEPKDSGTDRALSFQENIISHSLEFQDSEALNVISHGVSEQSDGTKIERYAFYDSTGSVKVQSLKPAGTLNTFKWPDITEAALDEIITRRLPNLYYSGIKGNLTTFGYEPIEHGDNVVLSDNEYEEREGTYKVKAVNIDFGQSGYRQTVELDAKVA